MCIEDHIQINMYHVSAQGVDERMIDMMCTNIIIIITGSNRLKWQAVRAEVR